jgi:thiamine pyrophosphokinase
VTFAIVVIGGSPPDPRTLRHLPRVDQVVCADSGFDHAVALGLDVDLLVGDMDSISPAGRRLAATQGVTVVEVDPDKDLTDTELALVAAASRGATSITLMTGGGDRLDHLLGVVAALTHDELMHLDHLEAWIGCDRLLVARPGRPVMLNLAPGSVVSLLPLAGAAHGVDTSGLQWPLAGDTLRADRARGVSNRTVEGEVSITVGSGALAVIVPGALDHPPFLQAPGGLA